MTEARKETKKRRPLLWILLAMLIIAGLVGGYWVTKRRQNNDDLLTNIETEPYQRLTLNASIYGTGTVQASQTAILIWSTKGIIGEVTISLGDIVEKDAVLMSLDPESVPVDVLQAQIDVINAQNTLDDLYDNWASDLAQAKLDLLKAQEDLEDLESERNIMNYQRCTDDRIEKLEDELDKAEHIYQFNQTSLTLQAVNTAQANLNYCLADYTEREIAEAELKVELGEARVRSLEEKVAVLSEGPDPDQVTILETQLNMAQSRLDSPLIKAPFTGTVTILDTRPGDVVSVGTRAVQIDDLSELNLEVQISEIDIPFVAVGQPADLVFDAYYESTYHGTVAEIAPVGTITQGVVEYTVRIRMTDADQRIKPGMTAAVNIIFEEKQEVYVVPNEAIVNIDGKDHVFVKRNGGYEAVPVVLGSYSDFYSEVINAEIEEGELIILNPPAEITGEMPFNGPAGGGFRGFGN